MQKKCILVLRASPFHRRRAAAAGDSRQILLFRQRAKGCETTSLLQSRLKRDGCLRVRWQRPVFIGDSTSLRSNKTQGICSRVLFEVCTMIVYHGWAVRCWIRGVFSLLYFTCLRRQRKDSEGSRDKLVASSRGTVKCMFQNNLPWKKVTYMYTYMRDIYVTHTCTSTYMYTGIHVGIHVGFHVDYLYVPHMDPNMHICMHIYVICKQLPFYIYVTYMQPTWSHICSVRAISTWHT